MCIPWLVSAVRPARAPVRWQAPVRVHRNPQFHNVDACIMCGACVAACTVHEVSKGFVGPAALAKADRFLSDPREAPSVTRARLSSLQDENGMWDCTRCNFCVEVCPKDVKPMEAIIRLRRASLERGLTKTGGARHILGFTDLVEQQGRLNEAIMPLKVVGFAPRGLLRILPLGIKMFLKGKIPNPFGHALPGLSQSPGLYPASETCHTSFLTPMAWTFRFLEDIAIADIGFEAEGESVEEVFHGATQALIESMANPATVSGGWERAIEQNDADPEALLFEWLSEVVYWKDAAGVVFREAPLALTREATSGCCVRV